MKEQLEKYLNAIIKDYTIYTSHGDIDEDVKRRSIDEFVTKLSAREGKNYIKVISNGAAHSFIVKEDGPKFKKGDILKPASWAAPAKNKARGNIFGEYRIRWTGPEYLRG